MWKLLVPQILINFILTVDASCVTCKSNGKSGNDFLGTTSSALACDDDKLIEYLAKIQVLNPEDIVQMPINNLESLCRDLDDVLKSSGKYLNNCTVSETNLYANLLKGVKQLDSECCCAESSFYAKLSKYYLCLHDLRNDYEACDGPPDWNEEPDNTKVCNANFHFRDFKNIVDCYYVKSAKVCGINAAKTVKDLAIKVVASTLCNTVCHGLNTNPHVPDPMPEKYVANGKVPNMEIDTKWMFILITILFLLGNYQ
ncbi:unnamed protein product [Acanthoscelides obtectus]|uniref:Uncharacterized protein n=1 Tax=Acanthoscelides obtectus TaxID=200917 RepID=A0A9P0PAC7_ACAOB|nr:unnamed protein product [Acanthoscelides obtectus]CAK1620592.1 hypothetical protein AOBTE_LOCUS463 [Acanthoscelides obtectus]